MIGMLRALLSTRWLRFPLSVAAAVLIFNAVARAAADGVIPDWAAAETRTAQDCTVLCPPAPAPTPGGGAPTPPPGGGGGGGLPTPTPTPLPPQAVGGFSSGGWYGNTSIAPRYQFGIIDSTVGSMGALCPWDYSSPAQVAAHEENAAEQLALRGLWNTGHRASAFFFLTSLYHVTNQCATPAPPGLTEQQWGAIQADYFVQFVRDACQQPCTALSVDRYFADVETVPWVVYDPKCACDVVKDKDLAGWLYDPSNAIVLSSFENTLLGYCPANNIPPSLCMFPSGGVSNGVYSSSGEMSKIFGASLPDLQTNTIWEAGYVYNDTPVSIVNADQNFFTNQGWAVYSWQYSTDACTVTLSNAQAMAQAASPPIPRFDRWTADGRGVPAPC